MIELFSSRELVIAFYSSILIIYAFCNRRIRPHSLAVIKSACNRHLAIPFFLMVCYAGIFVYALSFLSFWKWQYLKDIIIWVLFAGVPVCFSAINTKDEHYFRKIITDNLKFAALVEFISGTFTFSFAVELVIQPVIAILFLFQTVAERDKEKIVVKKFVDIVLALVGIVLISLTINMAITELADMNKLDLLVSFIIPIAFSLAYFPFAFLFAVYAGYENLFSRMSLRLPSNRLLRKKFKLKVILVCGLSYKSIHMFRSEYVSKLYTSISESEFRELLQEFKKRKIIGK